MNDPYAILGLTEDSTDSEITTAYHRLMKRYNSDSYKTSPLSDIADKRRKEIQEAYDLIIKTRKENKNKENSSLYNNDNSSPSLYEVIKDSQDHSPQNESSDFPDVIKALDNNAPDEAIGLLNKVDERDRFAEWYYLMGLAYSQKGWSDQAHKSFIKAQYMRPQNIQYSRAAKAAEEKANKDNSKDYSSDKSYKSNWCFDNFCECACSRGPAEFCCECCSALICDR